ncbi:hypothetical protein N474_16285 [Pseudoalteromonas luteoviolacea CPMOR-2]|uniref:Uncharacterized protein n=1 Tax=Pseudoalteromonas luteoviolacea DSM 6061 TaxID=1365250 RepID=A0A166VU08_9GAMM|nr:hypothetical protein N475_19645 [Pseudoalteromonas luteoviolacea DSM 6061]KZN55028.1 hypothetical protein N474_16285 [Pseudoalteromonas luteoviolacea CPMOR-2]MBE0389221.1 hypothetical protein [Pseudoalteromonas luteoviolacea DSM 6061]
MVLIASDAVIKQLKNTLNLAWKTIANHLTKIQQLYELGASPECIAGYVTRWLRWVKSGVTIALEQWSRTNLTAR